RRGFSPQSTNLETMVGTRVRGMVKKGQVRRAEDQAGFVLARSAHGKGAIPREVPRPTGKNAAQQSTPARPTVQAKPKALKSQPALRVLLTEILRKSKRPLAGGELAELVLE